MFFASLLSASVIGMFIFNRLLKNKFLSAAMLLSLASPTIFADSLDTTPTGIPLDTAWKQKVYAYAQTNVNHSAWGIAHSERDYQVSFMLAEQEGRKLDADVIFAAAFLHDLGAIDPFRQKEVEHSIRSVQLAEPLLQSYSFPMHKWSKVKAAILGHMYYAERPIEEEATILHDADSLDFLGIIGITRLISVTNRHAWAESLSGALTTLEQFKNDLPNKIITNTAKKIAAQRIVEMQQFSSVLNQETFAGNAV